MEMRPSSRRGGRINQNDVLVQIYKITLLKLLFSQQTGAAVLYKQNEHSSEILIWQLMDQTYQELPPRPMTEIGLQLIPSRTLRSSRTIPRRPKRLVPFSLLACSVESQHWIGPVLHWLAVVAVGVAVIVTVVVTLTSPRRVGVATARRGRTRRVEILENFIFRGCLSEIRRAGRLFNLLQVSLYNWVFFQQFRDPFYNKSLRLWTIVFTSESSLRMSEAQKMRARTIRIYI